MQRAISTSTGSDLVSEPYRKSSGTKQKSPNGRALNGMLSLGHDWT